MCEWKEQEIKRLLFAFCLLSDFRQPQPGSLPATIHTLSFLFFPSTRDAIWTMTLERSVTVLLLLLLMNKPLKYIDPVISFSSSLLRMQVILCIFVCVCKEASSVCLFLHVDFL